MDRSGRLMVFVCHNWDSISSRMQEVVSVSVVWVDKAPVDMAVEALADMVAVAEQVVEQAVLQEVAQVAELEVELVVYSV